MTKTKLTRVLAVICSVQKKNKGFGSHTYDDLGTKKKKAWSPQASHEVSNNVFWFPLSFISTKHLQIYSPFFQVMLESSIYLTVLVYSGCCLLAALASCFLPIETKGRGLQESSHREWGQEMVGRGVHNDGVTPSNSGSQEWPPHLTHYYWHSHMDSLSVSHLPLGHGQ